MNEFPCESLERLKDRVLEGSAIFFVGAGFSIDAEGNSGHHLIDRLLARFEALTQSMIKMARSWPRRSKTEALGSLGSRLRRELIETFYLDIPILGSLLTPRKKLDCGGTLSKDYYLFNDWIIDAFEQIFASLDRLGADERKRISSSAKRIEVDCLHRHGRRFHGGDILTPTSFNLGDYPAGMANRGKALFLDTMGFADCRVMAGEPNSEIDRVLETYRDRLLPRHIMLGWLAREGLCPVLLTTNYDLLLEGGYRIAGFSSKESNLPKAVQAQFNRITEAEDFFRSGHRSQRALIVKIHGCAETYRDKRSGEVDSWAEYLRSVIFTYREIQHWRDDDWSREFLKTQLRCHSVVFCGYSAADPVIHHTFRTVYEEMASRRSKSVSENEDTSSGLAFYFGDGARLQFHGREIVRASAAASGARGGGYEERRNLKNYVHFHRYSDPGKDCEFPNLDHLMIWIFHRVSRSRQAAFVESHLSRTAHQVFGRPAPRVEIKQIGRLFDELLEQERQNAESWEKGDQDKFSRTMVWTTGFHVSLIREMVLADDLAQGSRKGVRLREDSLRRRPWYPPQHASPEWVAWGVVLELALRRLAAAWREEPSAWMMDTHWIVPRMDNLPRPVLLRDAEKTVRGWRFPRKAEGALVRISQGPKRPTPVELEIRVDIARRHRSSHGLARRSRITWLLLPQCLPWRKSSSPDLVTHTNNQPSAHRLWRWACYGPDKTDAENLFGAFPS